MDCRFRVKNANLWSINVQTFSFLNVEHDKDLSKSMENDLDGGSKIEFWFPLRIPSANKTFKLLGSKQKITLRELVKPISIW